LTQEARKILSALQEQVNTTSRLNTISSFSGIVAIPFAFAGVIAGNQILSASALCWLVSHFIGYITRMIHEEHQQAVSRLNIAEATFLAKESLGQKPSPHHVSLN
jgi:hypothetical protein